MTYHYGPFRGPAPLTAIQRLREKRQQIKWQAEDRQKRGGKFFRWNIRNPQQWKEMSEPLSRWMLLPRKCRNLAQERAYDIPF